jgi:hypothetical protein
MLLCLQEVTFREGAFKIFQEYIKDDKLFNAFAMLVSPLGVCPGMDERSDEFALTPRMARTVCSARDDCDTITISFKDGDLACCKMGGAPSECALFPQLMARMQSSCAAAKATVDRCQSCD